MPVSIHNNSSQQSLQKASIDDSSLDRDSEEVDHQSAVKTVRIEEDPKEDLVKLTTDGTVDFNLTKTHFIGSGSIHSQRSKQDSI